MKKKRFLIGSIAVLCFAFLIFLPIAAKSSTPTHESAQAVVLAVSEQQTVEETTQEEQAEFDWSVWFKEECLPVLIAVGSAIVTICTILCPVLSTVNGGVKLFKGSKENFENVTNKVVESQNQITEFKETALAKIDSIEAQMEKQISNIADTTKESIKNMSDKAELAYKTFSKELEGLITQVENQIKVMKIAFGNNEELVKNGYANEIMKIGADNGLKEIKNKDNTDANS